jgi:hypothetical protein
MTTISFARHLFPPAIIRHTVWLYLRFTLSYRDVEDLLAERGLDAVKRRRNSKTITRPQRSRARTRQSAALSGLASRDLSGRRSVSARINAIAVVATAFLTGIGVLVRRMPRCVRTVVSTAS